MRIVYEIGVLERIVKVLEAEVLKETIPLDTNSFIYTGNASPRVLLLIILSNICMEKSVRQRLYDLGKVKLH